MLQASLLFPHIIPFCMSLQCSSIYSSFADFIFFLTSLYFSPAPVLVYFCCFSCCLLWHRSRTSFVTQDWIFFLCFSSTSSAVESSPSFRLFVRMSTSLSRLQGCKRSTYLSLVHFCYFGVFEFLLVKLDMKTLHEALGFQLQTNGFKHEVIITANVGIWEKSCVCFVDAGL